MILDSILFILHSGGHGGVMERLNGYDAWKTQDQTDEEYEKLCEWVYELTDPELVSECRYRDYDFSQDDDGQDLIPGRSVLESWLIDMMVNE